MTSRGGYALLAGIAVVTAIAAMHMMPYGRGLLARAGGCPFAGAGMTAAQSETARHMAITAAHDANMAPERPALGFALDRTTVDDVRAWARRRGVVCRDERGVRVTCTDVAPAAVGRPETEDGIDELSLQFDLRGRLVNVTAMHYRRDAVTAARAAENITESLARALGDARAAGEISPGRLARAGAESLATRTYRFRDYQAEVTAMNVSSVGPTIREHYMSAND